MLTLAQVKNDIEHWIKTFVEVPHPGLDNWAPCPYAQKARADGAFDVRLGGASPLTDLIDLSCTGLATFDVIILVYDPAQHPYSEFHDQLNSANSRYLRPMDIIVLEDHPADPEIVHGISMNQGTYALALVQKLSKLNDAARLVAKKGFYNSWPEQYLQLLFKHRQDPRS